MFEALLRVTAVHFLTMVRLHSECVTGGGGGAAASAAAAAKQTAASMAIAAQNNLLFLSSVMSSLVTFDMAPIVPQSPSALALAALSAGPGSQVQRQLFSLLCSMVKVGNTHCISTEDADMFRNGTAEDL
jgi:hypothetical protein